MPRLITLILLCASLLPCVSAQAVMTLQQCRDLAIANSKQSRIHDAELQAAEYTKRQARAAYLPAIDFTGAYVYNQKNLSVISEDAYLPVKSFDLASQGYQFDVVKNPYTGQPVIVDGKPIPSQVALLPKDALTFDIHNVFAGALTLTQPIFMGGKIVALNKLADAGKEAAAAMRDRADDNIVYDVDAAYWLVVSLKAKERLATSYVALLDTLRYNVTRLLDEGMATKADLLSVDVKLNQGQVDLTKVTNGLSLARMALAQKCGLPIDSPMVLADENGEVAVSMADEEVPPLDMPAVYERRNDLRALRAAVKASDAESSVALSSMLPNIALVGAYSFSTPNMFDGFKNKVGGMFSIGVMASVPLWHWGGNYYKYKAAKTRSHIASLEVEDAKEMIDLQVHQARYKMQEAIKTYHTSVDNMAKADENLRCATLAYREGVSTTDLVMEAQTAWLKAASEEIDSRIDVRLCHVYLDKVLGILSAPPAE
ncbi:MAG: TolC family protein [Candidatus Amulumruptor sp.]